MAARKGPTPAALDGAAGLGLYPPPEAPGALERHSMAFLSGAEDDRLRRTGRVHVNTRAGTPPVLRDTLGACAP